jgi:hypothetical protein
MTAPITQARSEGSLYELIAKGNKDAYFFRDHKESLFLFDNAYEAQAPYSYEIRRVTPRTAAEFGRSIEFDFDLVGDFMTNPSIIINLPSWYPVQQEKSASTSVFTDASGVYYGYTSGIGYFLFENIQFFQDNILLQEFSGDSLWAINKTEGTYGQGWVSSELAGEHDNSSISIGRNAVPGQLRIALPLVGCQGHKDAGFPQRAVTSHSYRLRCKLRKLEDLVEDSIGSVKPKPWGKVFTQNTSSGSTSFTTLDRTAINPLLLQLETRQVYVTREIQDIFSKKPQSLPFRRIFENVFSQNHADYINVLAGGTSAVNKRLDGRHPTGRILWYFRAVDDINKNKLWKINTSTNTPYYNSVTLNIAGQSRELPRTPLVWRDINNFAKEDLDTGIELSSMNFTLGSVALERFPNSSLEQPTGTINMTTADRPTLYMNLSNPQSTTPATQLYVLVEGWSLFETDGKGKAYLFSAN